MSDQTQTITLALKGDTSARKQLLLDHKDLISAVVSRFVFDRQNGKDVIQNVFVKVLEQLKKFKGSCKFSTWVYRIAVNESIDFNRKKETIKKHIIPDTGTIPFADPNAQDALSTISGKRLLHSVRTIVETLPLDQKTVFSLYYFGRYSGKEIASVMNITETNCFMKLKSARDRIKNDLRKQGWIVHE